MKLKYLFFLFLLFFSQFSFTQIKNVASLEQNIIDLQAEISTIKEKIEILKEDLQKRQKDISRNIVDSNTRTEAITNTKTEPIDTNTKTDDLTKQIQKLDLKLDDIVSKIDAKTALTSTTKTQEAKTNENEKNINPSNKQTKENVLNQLTSKVNTIQKKLNELLKYFRQKNNSQSELIKRILKNLEKEIKEGSVVVVPISNKAFKIKIVSHVLFKQAEVSLSKEGKKRLQKIVPVLKELKNKDIFVIGHADKTPITGDLLKAFYPTNWELSAIRAVIIVRYLTEELGFSPDNLIASARSKYAPINKSSSKKALDDNRRIEFWILERV